MAHRTCSQLICGYRRATSAPCSSSKSTRASRRIGSAAFSYCSSLSTSQSTPILWRSWRWQRVSCSFPRLALGGRQRRAPWIVAGVVWNHALCSDSPEHPTDIAFHRFSEGQLCEAVELGGEACKGVIVATLPRAEQRRLHIRQRRAHPD